MTSSQQPLSDLATDLGRMLSELEPDVARLGALGWTIPIWAPFSMIRGALEHTEEEIDAGFVVEYRRQFGKHERQLFRQIIARPSLAPWAPLLRECRAAYDRRLFRVCVPSLITALEGTVATFAGGARTRTSPVKLLRRHLKTIGSPAQRLLWVSVLAFLEVVFKDTHFGSPHPPRLNRHWLLHGRSFAATTRADALRIAQALDTVSLVGQSSSGDSSAV